MITYGSACSGIESASLAWEPLGWRASWFAEIEPFPCAVLAYHWPHVPNLGDMTRIHQKVLWGSVAAPDVLIAGTPCQAFSVAGLREGLDDDRGQLTLSYMRLCDANDFIRRREGKPETVIVWENVPGVLSSKDNAFGCFLAGLAGDDAEIEPSDRPETGKSNKYWRWDKKTCQHIPKWSNAGCVIGPKRTVAWRVLDAQYFGVAQRRRRVFVVASARAGFNPAAVLFEQEGVRRDIAPSREAREEITGPLESRSTAGGFPGTDGAISGHVQPVGGRNNGCENVLIGALTTGIGTKYGAPEVDACVYWPFDGIDSHARKLMPVECERLQGMPEWKNTISISVINERGNQNCSDNLKSHANAESQSHKLQKHAGNAGKIKSKENAKSAEKSFQIKNQSGGEPVEIVNVQIDLERKHLLIHKAKKLILSVSFVEKREKSPLLVPIEDFVQLAVTMTTTADPIAQNGKVEFRAKEISSSHQKNGNQHKIKFGPEISELASDAKRFTKTVKEFMKSITSQVGQNSQHSGSILKTSSCFVLTAISGFTPELTLRDSSFTLKVTVSGGHTLIPWRGKPAEQCPDGPRYKAIGNSKAVDVVKWLGVRIANEISKVDAA